MVLMIMIIALSPQKKLIRLAKDELVAANHIGDTENTAAVAQDTDEQEYI